MGASELLQLQQQHLPSNQLPPLISGAAALPQRHSGAPTSEAGRAHPPPLTKATAAAPVAVPASINSTIGSALGTVTSRVAAAAQVVSTPGRAATPVALRIAGKGAHAQALHGRGDGHAGPAPSHSDGARASADRLLRAPSPAAGTPLASAAEGATGGGGPGYGFRGATPGSDAKLPAHGVPATPGAQRGGGGGEAGPGAGRGAAASGAPRSGLPRPYAPLRAPSAATAEISEPLKLLQQLSSKRLLPDASPAVTAKPALTVPSPRPSPPAASAGLVIPSPRPQATASAGLPSAAGGRSAAGSRGSRSPQDSMRSSAGSAATFGGTGGAGAVLTPGVGAHTPVVAVDPVQAQRAARRYG